VGSGRERCDYGSNYYHETGQTQGRLDVTLRWSAETPEVGSFYDDIETVNH
jgi:hypothetical protein